MDPALPASRDTSSSDPRDLFFFFFFGLSLINNADDDEFVCVLCCDGISNKPPRLTELNKNTLSNLISSRLPAPPLTPVATATPWGDEPHIPRPDDGLSRPRPGYGGGRLGVHWCEG